MTSAVPAAGGGVGIDPELARRLASQPRHWLVTGSAGFIGSNLDEVRALVGEEAWSRHRFIEADIADPASCLQACDGVDLVLHQAALGSVPRSIKDPLTTHRSNATGFLNMLDAARQANVKRFVYAASSSTYGDSPALPKVEDVIGKPLSPYAVTKYLNELYADVFGRTYGMQTIGLRYFNVFGPRQSEHGPYAAVFALWAGQMLRGERCVINGDGETSRDFCFIANTVQANLRAALVEDEAALNQVYNVAVGQQTTLLQLHAMLADALVALQPGLVVEPPTRREFRAGDVRHSLADISKIRERLGYSPTHDVAAGLAEAVTWYRGQHTANVPA